MDRTRDVVFAGLHLLPPLGAMVALPVALAWAGAPDLAQSLSLLLLQAPLVSVLLRGRGVAFRLTQGVVSFGFIAFGLALALAFPHYEFVAYLVFAVALLEAGCAMDPRITIAAGTTILAAVAVLALPGSVPATSVAGGPIALAAIPVLLYAAALAGAVAHLVALRIRFSEGEAARRRSMEQAIGDLILQVDRGGVVLSCGAEVGTLFALTPRDMSGRGFYERIHLADRPAFLQALSGAFEGREAVVATLRLRTATVHSTRGAFQEPVHRWIELRPRRLGLNTDLALCLVRDVTAVKEQESEIGQARLSAERAQQSRERFLANVSHELRTPLNAIIGFADLLAMEKVANDPEKRAEYAKIISTSGHHLLSVVNSILDMSKLEAGSFDIEPKHVSPAPLLAQCFDIVRLKARENGVTLVRDYPDELPVIVADERALRQIVINLLSNAVKFSQRGGAVTLTARADAGLLLCVEDTGIGIAADDMKRLGDAFFQASNARSRAFEGTGLGLSLVRGLVGLHGGGIDVESAPGAGTLVTVRLPADCRGAQARSAPATIHVIARPAPLSASTIPAKVKTRA